MNFVRFSPFSFKSFRTSAEAKRRKSEQKATERAEKTRPAAKTEKYIGRESGRCCVGCVSNDFHVFISTAMSSKIEWNASFIHCDNCAVAALRSRQRTPLRSCIVFKFAEDSRQESKSARRGPESASREMKYFLVLVFNLISSAFLSFSFLRLSASKFMHLPQVYQRRTMKFL